MQFTLAIYQAEIKTVYSDLRTINFLKKMYFYVYLKKDKAVYIAKNPYFDTLMGIKTNRDTFG